jgi:hypothetical protein
MKKKFAALIVLVLLGLPGSANALETDELIAITAMPLVVAAAAELSDVPTVELMSVVTTLNNAAVPPIQFVEVVRYAPVAIVAPVEPRFTTYVTTEYARGVVGAPLAFSIAERYPMYGVRAVRIVDPPVLTYVERRTILPQVVITRFEPQPIDPLALVAMPLAVAAVADITDVPPRDLISFITSLNRARVPAPQFVEVVRYSPVVLVDSDVRPVFLRYVTTEIDRGVIGRPLAFSLADRIRVADIDIIDPPTRIIVDRDEFLPPVVATRVVTTRAHPHGGPPGQLKKDLGPQTGAEVVHGTRTRRSRSQRTVVVDRDRPARPARPKKVQRDRDRNDRPPPPKVRRDRSRDRGEARVSPSGRGDDDRPRGKARVSKPSKSQGSQGRGGGKGRVGGKGKGKGKG